MQISAEALHGIPGDTTLSVVVHFGTHQAIALVDSGSSKTFLDEEFIKKAKLKTQPTQAHKVIVAGGGELTSYYFLNFYYFAKKSQLVMCRWPDLSMRVAIIIDFGGF
jgi:hypothetical protein